jgi:uncharacterized protein (UPF0335 family)
MAKVNGFDTKKAEPFLARIEQLLADIETEKSGYMNAAKAIRSDVKEVFAEAEEAGVNKKALKGLVKYRDLERKQAKIDADFEGDDSLIYDALVDQLGELGAAAKAARTKSAQTETSAAAH